jgi:hypothetical protein
MRRDAGIPQGGQGPSDFIAGLSLTGTERRSKHNEMPASTENSKAAVSKLLT